MNRIACPDCGSDLGRGATKCRCGWKTAQTLQAEANPEHVPCAADAGCRYAGRLWVYNLGPQERICVNHYYRWIDENRGLPIPVQTNRAINGSRMLGIVPKPVAGAD